MKAFHCSHCFSNLATPSRMKIFLFLKENGPQIVSKIVEKTSLSQPTISYHLKNMQKSGLLSKKRIGKEICYEINNNCPDSHEVCVIKQMNFTN